MAAHAPDLAGAAPEPSPQGGGHKCIKATRRMRPHASASLSQCGRTGEKPVLTELIDHFVQPGGLTTTQGFQVRVIAPLRMHSLQPRPDVRPARCGPTPRRRRCHKRRTPSCPRRSGSPRKALRRGTSATRFSVLGYWPAKRSKPSSRDFATARSRGAGTSASSTAGTRSKSPKSVPGSGGSGTPSALGIAITS